MSVVLIVLIVGFAIAAAVALVRGLIAFHNDAEQVRRGGDPMLLKLGLKQNRMMMQRVLFQGIAIVLIVIFGMVAAKS